MSKKKDKKIEKYYKEYLEMIEEDDWTRDECAYVLADTLYERNKFAKQTNKLNKKLAIALVQLARYEYVLLEVMNEHNNEYILNEIPELKTE